MDFMKGVDFMKTRLKKGFSLLLCICLMLSLFAGCKKENAQDIVVLYTNDIHCGFEDHIGYAGLAAYHSSVAKKTPYVTLVDLGDAIQGDVIGTVSKGEYIIDMMNEVGYDLAILGNHEFDYGIDRLRELIDQSEATYLGCNLTYTGSGENKLSAVKPYEILSYGNTDVAYIGVTTPETTTSSTPSYFQENGEFVYGFTGGTTTDDFYACVQAYVDECLEKGAEYVVILSHIGDDQEESLYNSVDLIRNTTGIDVVLDAHAHSEISSRVEENKNGEDVLLSSTGTKLANIGQLVITADGYISTGLISSYSQKDADTDAYIQTIKSSYEADMNRVVTTSDITLSCYAADGARLVRNRETAIGNLCADAYRAISGADISLVNGGGIRADIEKGDITYGDIITVHPFGNMLCMVKASGQEILDSLEIASRATKAEYSENGNAVGEDGSFQHVSGLRYTIDTTVESTVVFDENGMFVAVTGARRVCDVYVLNPNGEYEPLDPEKIYTVASHNYLLKDSGGGITVFADNELLIDEGMADYQVLITYIESLPKGTLEDSYSHTEGRITVK